MYTFLYWSHAEGCPVWPLGMSNESSVVYCFDIDKCWWGTLPKNKHFVLQWLVECANVIFTLQLCTFLTKKSYLKVVMCKICKLYFLEYNFMH
jgi:hypothetical protein